MNTRKIHPQQVQLLTQVWYFSAIHIPPQCDTHHISMWYISQLNVIHITSDFDTHLSMWYTSHLNDTSHPNVIHITSDCDTYHIRLWYISHQTVIHIIPHLWYILNTSSIWNIHAGPLWRALPCLNKCSSIRIMLMYGALLLRFERLY